MASDDVGGENSDPKTQKTPGATRGENSDLMTQKVRARRRRESQLTTAAPLESSTLRWTPRELSLIHI